MSSNNCNNGNNNINLEVTTFIAFSIFHCIKECFLPCVCRYKGPQLLSKNLVGYCKYLMLYKSVVFVRD